jgi:glycerol uptake facilitator-like aquaporin
MISGGLSGGIYVVVGLMLIIIGLYSSTATFGQSFALIILGILYMGIGLCMITGDSVMLNNAITTVVAILGLIGLFIPFESALVLYVMALLISYSQNYSNFDAICKKG